MCKDLVALIVTSIVGVGHLQGQESRMAVTGSGYDVVLPIAAAPGQLLTLFVQSPGIPTQNVRAPDGVDLPRSLAGIRVGMILPPPSLTVMRLPIASVGLARACIDSVVEVFAPCSRLVAVTIQVPYELDPFRAGGSIGVSSDEASSYGVDVTSYADQVHIVRVLDTIAPQLGRRMPICQGRTTQFQAPLNWLGLPCPAFVTHANGELVTADSPARSDEALTAYAVGLGRTSPASETGKVVVTSAPTETEYGLDFNYRPNALATKPRPLLEGAPRPLYTGTTPGYVGLYQINFVVPAVPPGTRPCSPEPEKAAVGANLIYSNLTVSVGGQHSFDGAGICVAVE